MRKWIAGLASYSSKHPKVVGGVILAVLLGLGLNSLSGSTTPAAVPTPAGTPTPVVVIATAAPMVLPTATVTAPQQPWLVSEAKSKDGDYSVQCFSDGTIRAFFGGSSLGLMLMVREIGNHAVQVPAGATMTQVKPQERQYEVWLVIAKPAGQASVETAHTQIECHAQ